MISMPEQWNIEPTNIIPYFTLCGKILSNPEISILFIDNSTSSVSVRKPSLRILQTCLFGNLILQRRYFTGVRMPSKHCYNELFCNVICKYHTITTGLSAKINAMNICAKVFWCSNPPYNYRKMWEFLTCSYFEKIFMRWICPVVMKNTRRYAWDVFIRI